MSLIELTVEYFKAVGYDVRRDVELQGRWNIRWKFDLLLEDDFGLLRGVWIRNWKRTVGVNVVLMLDRASEDVGLGKPLLIANGFSISAYAYATRRGIELLTFEEILGFLRKSAMMPHRYIPE
ncbi:hypothetical protein KEJ27_01900 [Candidatus Bathyarchaeota archaeon]|nr:hypothetical protein [Candidatus Bathyarchaeota archaeon]MBS7612911.1 hypothetical protein [Candidatus Bathyarchaeota archaeon]MBS7617801.1 hypothetical protein [Candidatus Bathyarchaeota archaeon]